MHHDSAWQCSRHFDTGALDLPEAGVRTSWCAVPNCYQDEIPWHAFVPDESAFCALEQGPSWSTLDLGGTPSCRSTLCVAPMRQSRCGATWTATLAR